jgi:hypothetical protein
MGLRATFRRLSGNSRSFHPSGRAAVVAATVFLGAMGALSADTVARVSAPAGARPGSFSFHPERSVVYPKVAASAFHPKASGRGWRLRPSVKDEKAVYVSDAGANVVDVFDKKGRLTGQITGFSQPQGIAVDDQGNLYVADTNNQEIKVFAPGTKTPSSILSDPNGYPSSVDVALDGTVGITNVCSAPSCGQGDVEFYAAGSTNPTSKCAVAGLLATTAFGGFDKSDDFYADGMTASGQPALVECKAGSSTASRTAFVFAPNGVGGGVFCHQIEGFVNVTDQHNPETARFDPVSGKMQKPVVYSGIDDPVQPGPDDSNQIINVPNGSQTARVVNTYPYPKGKKVKSQITGFTQAVGVAVFPRGIY